MSKSDPLFPDQRLRPNCPGNCSEQGSAFWRVVLAIVGVVALLAGAITFWLYHRARQSLPQLDGEIQLDGLKSPVEVLRDPRGVPHLRAQSVEDLCFAQGYITAQDRLWQMDLSRRRAEGELAEILGERGLKLDVEVRTLGFPEVLKRGVAGLDPDTKAMFAAYARGVNAFMETHQDDLPIEFLILDYKPRPWTVEDSLSVALNMAKVLSTTWPDDLYREQVHSKVSQQLYDDLFPATTPLDHPVAELAAKATSAKKKAAKRKPATMRRAAPGRRKRLKRRRRVPAGARQNLATIGTSSAAGHKQSLEGTASGGETGPSSGLEQEWKDGAGATAEDLMFGPAMAELPDGALEPPVLGSNNWVVSGAHTASGKPLLANDPHLHHTIPSVWYMIHLKSPQMDVTGVSLPGLPLVVIGHNQSIAWGLTNTGPDVQDLFIEAFNPQNPDEYQDNGRWLSASVKDETIKVRGRQDYHLRVVETRHGPIVSHSGGRNLALEWTALQPQGIQFPFLKLNEAQNWQQFTGALREFPGPMQNFVYADTGGNIGYYAAGIVPIRKQGDGSVPVPGNTGDYDWTGVIPFEDLPQSYNPASGIIATANGRVVPDGYPYLITRNWESSPYRTARIFQLLQSGTHFTVANMQRIQADIQTLDDAWLAKRLLLAAQDDPPTTSAAQYALGLLVDWDGQARMRSGATLVCRLTNQVLRERILTSKLGPDMASTNWAMGTVFLQNVIDNNLTRWLPHGDANFNQTLIQSLEEAVARIPATIRSTRRSDWQWGRAIPLAFHHPLFGDIPFVDRIFDVGPYPQSGTSSTVKAVTSSHGPSMRMVVDFADFDQSVQNITLGESGQITSPYYKNQFNAWYDDRSFPMLFSDQSVDSQTAHRLTLTPASGP
ncbi:MAG TPA: penicillin acylase family protein [Terriglobia bacterium]|nr:penicillin acylase family protein [Terriglobia bacterium]